MNATDHSHANEFLRALQTHAPRYGVQLDARATALLSEYYEQVTNWNARLHLVAPCSPIEFATRHVLESLHALPYLPEEAQVLDVGSGAGLPVIPCLIVRSGLRATLVESSIKKSVFLRETLRRLLPESGALIINRRFEEIAAPPAGFVTCRALERFTEKFQQLAEWSPQGSTLLFFGGPSLRERIEAEGFAFSSMLLPESEQRYLFIIKRDL
ncbi:MAG TPA: RsmG family class I SAM-dependent methyltransferase [Pyrinomonadaceae bacterium]|jgi:16S rRNA (guanine527-N7)-methyltransferase